MFLFIPALAGLLILLTADAEIFVTLLLSLPIRVLLLCIETLLVLMTPILVYSLLLMYRLLFPELTGFQNLPHPTLVGRNPVILYRILTTQFPTAVGQNIHTHTTIPALAEQLRQRISDPSISRILDPLTSRTRLVLMRCLSAHSVALCAILP